MLGIILKTLICFSIISAIIMYLLIVGANANKSEYEKQMEIEEEMNFWKKHQNQK